MYKYITRYVQELLYLQLSTDYFMKISLDSWGPDQWSRIIMKQSDRQMWNADKLTSVISAHKALHWTLYHVWFQNKSELYYENICILLVIKGLATFYKLRKYVIDRQTYHFFSEGRPFHFFKEHLQLFQTVEGPDQQLLFILFSHQMVHDGLKEAAVLPNNHLYLLQFSPYRYWHVMSRCGDGPWCGDGPSLACRFLTSQCSGTWCNGGNVCNLNRNGSLNLLSHGCLFSGSDVHNL